MKIVNIVPGFGGTFYCGNCLRDSAFTTSLRKAGHEAVILPMYLPLTLDGKMAANDTPVFYGAVNIYLKEAVPFLRKMPAWLEKLLNAPAMLRLAARFSGSTRASGLEGLTESMLLGEQGHQRQELRELVDYLKNHEKPDVVHFSNALLIGLAREIRHELNIPVVCSLQDEDVWIDAMHPDLQQHFWDLLAERGKDVDAFIPVSRYFAGLMQEKMQIPPEKMHVLPIGIDFSQYEYHLPLDAPLTIGFLSRMNEENGFGLLMDAFIELKSKPGFEGVKLVASGGSTGDDRKFIRKQLRKLEAKGWQADFSIIPDFDLEAKKAFFRRISVLSVPVLKGEAFGLFLLEALASGIPLVQPELGAFPEIIAGTAGGWTYTPNSPGALAITLAEALKDPRILKSTSENAYAAARQQYDATKLTERMSEIYEEVLKNIKP